MFGYEMTWERIEQDQVRNNQNELFIWEDAQADLSLRWAHIHFFIFFGFVVSRLICFSAIHSFTLTFPLS